MKDISRIQVFNEEYHSFIKNSKRFLFKFELPWEESSYHFLRTMNANF